MTVTDRAKPTIVYDAAEQLVRLGVSVIPIQPGIKDPPYGFKWGQFAGRIADASERYEWFVESGYQLAAVVGEVSGGLIVLDFDAPDGFGLMAARYPVIRTYPRVKSSRGHHVWIRSERRTKMYDIFDQGRKLQVIDGGTTSSKHYAMVPPSVHPDGPVYQWEVPPWDGIPTVDLEDLGLHYEDPTASAPGEPISHQGKPLSERNKLLIVDALSPYYVEGQRNPLVMALAGWMAYKDVPESDVVEIADALRPYCPGPDDARKLRDVIHRTYKQASEGIAVKGWSALTDRQAPLISPGAAKRLDLLLRDRDPKLSFVRDTDDSEADEDESDDEPEALPFRLIPFGNLGSLPDPEELIQGFFQVGTVAVVYGDGGSYKSFLALDMALHIANGEEWCGKPAKQGQVIYIAAEGAAGIKKRVKAWSLAHDLPMDNAWLLPESMQLTQPDQIEGFIASVKAQGIQPAFIVVDTLSQNSLGADENSSDEMAIVFDAAQRLASTFHAVVLVVHHSNKLGGYRGATAIKNNVYTFMSMERSEKDDTATLKAVKQRDLEPFDPMVFVPQQIVIKPATDLLPPVTSLVLNLAGEEATGRSRHKVPPDTVYATLARRGWSTQEDLVKELKVSDSTVRRILKEMIEKQTVKKRERQSGRISWMVYATIEEPDDAPDF